MEAVKTHLTKPQGRHLREASNTYVCRNISCVVASKDYNNNNR